MNFGTFIVNAAHSLTFRLAVPLLFVGDFHSQASSQRHPHLQPAPRARLLSLCTVTLESFRVSLSMALRSAGYSDWSMGYMP